MPLSLQKKLINRIWDNPKFHELADRCHAEALENSLSHKSPSLSIESLKKLFQCATLLTASSKEEHKIKAYEVAVSAFVLGKTFQNFPRNALFRIVLSELGNFPAFETDEGVSKAQSSLPFKLLIQELDRKEQNSVTLLSQKNITFTDFQKKTWNQLSKHKNTAIIGPTSAGKSFLLENFIDEQTHQKSKISIVYLVPTRALINQVSNDLHHNASIYQKDLEIITFPIESLEKIPAKAIFLYTQERLHKMLSNHPKFSADIVIIDEAQSLNVNSETDSRPILLQTAITDLLDRNKNSQAIFLGPNIKNPGIFLKIFSLSRFSIAKSRQGTVGQNFIFIDYKGRKLTAAIRNNDNKILLFEEKLDAPLKTNSKKLAHAYSTLGQNNSSIIYANGPALAEHLAQEIITVLQNKNVVSPDIQKRRSALANAIKETIHPKFILADTIEAGIGFHYGNLPSFIRSLIENAFKDYTLHTVISTSTLLSGVNLPAKNLFLLKPTQGTNNPLTNFDFWNMAGRAGRLKKEFQGNIFLIDYDKWSHKPLEDEKEFSIKSIGEQDNNDLFKKIRNILTNSTSASNLYEESITNRLIIKFSEVGEHAIPELLPTLNSQNKEILSQILEETVGQLSLPPKIAKLSPTISPIKQNKLYLFLKEKLEKNPHTFDKWLLRHPTENDAYENYTRILKKSCDFFSKTITEKQVGLYIWAAFEWMRETPLSRIIESSITRDKQKTPDDFNDKKISTIIRNTLELLNQKISFFLTGIFSCYYEITNFLLQQYSSKNLPALVDPTLYLELGTCAPRTIALIEFGFSRYTAITLSKNRNFKFDPKIRSSISNALEDMDPERLPLCAKFEVERLLPKLNL